MVRRERNRSFRKHFIGCLIALSALLPQAAFALGLEEAKDRGLVGEQPDGYLGMVSEPAASEVRQLVQEINARRRQQYQEIARRNGTEQAAVEALAGKKAIERSEPGHFVLLPSAKWEKK